MEPPGVRAMNEADAILVKKILDNEILPGERIDFLARAELNPELWRELALGLLENRTWTEMLRPRSNEGDLMPASPKSQIQQKRRGYFLAGAVAAVMGIAAGWFLGVIWPIQTPTTAKVAPVDSPWYLGNPRLAGYPATKNVQAVDEAIVPLQARERLKRLGVDVQESTVIYLLENESGDHVAFPARQAAFRFPGDQ